MVGARERIAGNAQREQQNERGYEFGADECDDWRGNGAQAEADGALRNGAGEDEHADKDIGPCSGGNSQKHN